MIADYRHDDAERVFLTAVVGDRMPPVWLLAGNKGAGKAAFAARAAGFVIAGGATMATAGAPSLRLPDDDLDTQLSGGIALGALLKLQREAVESDKGRDPKLARNITIEQVRGMIARLRTKAVDSQWRVVIVDSIDDCERGAANALLKTLEEPPEQTLFLLISHAPGRLLPTLRSRCRLLRFQPVEQDFGGDEEYAALFEKIADTGDPHNLLRAELGRACVTAASQSRLDDVLKQGLAWIRSRAESASTERAAVIQAFGRITEIRRYASSASEDPSTVGFAVGTALSTLAVI